MPVDRVIGLYIDNNLVPDMPAVAFEEQVDVVFMDAIPLGATGKMQKIKLREQLAGYTLPGL